jgi:hypothetical protein
MTPDTSAPGAGRALAVTVRLDAAVGREQQ